VQATGLSGYDVTVTDEETLTALGLLAQKARNAKGVHKKAAAAAMHLNEGTLYTLEYGKTRSLPNPGTRTSVEAYYGWRHGSIQDLWDMRRDLRFEDVSLELMRPGKPTGLAKASELTDQELMAELNFRFLMRDTRRD